MTHPALKAMVEAAKKATPGPWIVKTIAEWQRGFDFFEGPEGAFVFPVDLEPEDAAHITTTNPANILSLDEYVRGLEDALRTAQDIIDGAREDLHQRRVGDWYPEGAHNAAAGMSEDMRLIGNRLADVNVLAALGGKPTT